MPRALLAVYIACFLAGAFNHGLDFLAHGVRPYRGFALPLELFWTSLIALDLGVVALLLRGWWRAGLALALAVMVTDVAVNSYALIALDIAGLTAPLLLQTLFLGFILGSIVFLWPRQSA